jgi:putrescine transport system permease protein
MKKRSSIKLLIFMGLGFAFLYIPILILIIYSFNASKLVAVWGGFSTQWYGKLLEDQGILDAFKNSLQIALFVAFASTILGTIAGYVMARFGRFRGHSAFASTVTAPLVIPEIIDGLAALLLFVSLERVIGWPSGRGMLTIGIAHVTFATAFVAIVVSSRLRDMDLSIEEAAMDLGAPPLKVFFVIVLPIITPALISGWLLSFSLSMDDLVITSFVAGPGSTTLPMKVFSAARLGISPKINAIGSLIVLVATIFVISFGVISSRMDKKRKLEEQQAFEGA